MPSKNYLTAAANLKIEGIANDINSGDEKKEKTALRALKILTKKCYCGKRGILINANYSNVIPKLVEFLSSVGKADLQMDSAEILTNIASGTADQAKAVVSAGAVAGIISMVCSLDGRVADNAGFQLAWLASRRQELQEEIIKPLLMLIKPDTPVTLLQRVIDALCTFCYNLDNRTDNSPPTFILPALAHLLRNNDELIIKEACHAFIYFQGSDEVIQEVVDAGVVPRLVALLQHREVAIVPCPRHCPIFSILRAIGGIASGAFDRAGAVVGAGAVAPLISFLGSHRDVAEAALFALSGIADFGPELRNCVIEQGIIRPLLSLIKLDITPDVTLLRLVTRALSSLCYSHKEESPLTVPVIQQLLTGLAHLSHHNNDDEILTAACKALSNLGMNIVENKKAFLSPGPCSAILLRTEGFIGHISM